MGKCKWQVRTRGNRHVPSMLIKTFDTEHEAFMYCPTDMLFGRFKLKVVKVKKRMK